MMNTTLKVINPYVAQINMRAFTEELHHNSLKWQRFSEQNQLDEIRAIWPNSSA